jgi:5-(carboxyamino)imidazole ribonucleotide synthase
VVADHALAPGATIGILGGGQLARMLALAAAQLGLKCHIFAPEVDSPAFQVSAVYTIADYGDEDALSMFAAGVDVITYEFENVPVKTVSYLENLVPVRPGAKALRVAQDRLEEKRVARELGLRTAAYGPVNSLVELKSCIDKIGLPAILKTTRMGYDGKGQAKIMGVGDIGPAFIAMRGQAAILEGFVNFDCEVSVIGARGLDGAFVAYDVTENLHRNHILHTSTVPARISTALAKTAVTAAQGLGEALDYVGVFGVEFFVAPGGLYVNEIAPRVHNSGHWTQNACVVSQFEQHIRAVCGWPLGDPTRHSDVVMTNLLGEESGDWATLAQNPQVALHLYGKAEARTGRKMGHFNRITPRQG